MKRNQFLLTGFFLFAFALICSTALAVPGVITYQGELTNLDSTPVDNGTYTISFKIYTIENGGSSIWDETLDVSVMDGIYNVTLGTTKPFSSTVLNEPQLYLGITVGSDSEMIPRQEITSTFFALKAGDSEKIGGKTLSDLDNTYVNEGQEGSVTSPMITDSTITQVDLAPNSVGSNEVASGAVGTSEISDHSVTADDLAKNSVNSGIIADNSITGNDLQDSAVTGPKLADNAVTNAKILDGTITGSDINNTTTITAGKLQGGGTTSYDVGAYGESSSKYGMLGYNSTSGNYGYLGSSSTGVRGYNSSSGNYGYFGSSNYGGFGWSSTGYGLYGSTSTGIGVRGYNSTSGNYGYLGSILDGVYGESSSRGVYGYNSTSGNYGYLGSIDYGVYGSSLSNYGVFGWSSSSYGVFGGTSSYIATYGKHYGSGNYGYLGSIDYGVYGYNPTSGNYGCLGSSDSGVYGNSSSGTGVSGRSLNGYGVTGTNSTSDNYGYLGSSDSGVYGNSQNSYGVYGESLSGYGVYGKTSRGYAGFFLGNVYISGNLTKSSGSFMIDHPLWPESMYLYHSFVESPDMMNIYNGNVMLDANGEAWVELPSYFHALNSDYRYQLTCIGGYAPVYIAEEITNNRFRIAGGKPEMKVSWQVTGIRQDPYATAHRIIPEVEKTGKDRGRYLHPKEYGVSDTLGINYEKQNRIDTEQEKLNGVSREK